MAFCPIAILTVTSPIVIIVINVPATPERFIGCRNKGFFCSVVGKIEMSKELFVNSEFRYYLSFFSFGVAKVFL